MSAIIKKSEANLPKKEYKPCNIRNLRYHGSYNALYKNLLEKAKNTNKMWLEYADFIYAFMYYSGNVEEGITLGDVIETTEYQKLIKLDKNSKSLKFKVIEND